MRVVAMTGIRGRAVANQVIIEFSNEEEVFVSYGQPIAAKLLNGQVILDKYYWDYSKTTGKYRNKFLGETKKETNKKIESGEYELDDLSSELFGSL